MQEGTKVNECARTRENTQAAFNMGPSWAPVGPSLLERGSNISFQIASHLLEIAPYYLLIAWCQPINNKHDIAVIWFLKHLERIKKM